MKIPKEEMTAEIAREHLAYDPESGLVTAKRRLNNGHRPIGSEWGTLHANWSGKYYRQGMLFYTKYYLHRMAFLLQVGRWPEGEIDHIDGNGLNNRWNNLREVTPTENQRNARKRSDNTSGTTGVGWHKQRQKWKAQIRINGTQKHLGYFDSKEEAIWARDAANKEHEFHANHGTERPL